LEYRFLFTPFSITPIFFQEQLGRKAVRNVLFSNSFTTLHSKTVK